MNRCLPGGVMSMRHHGHRRVLVSLLVVLLGFAAPCPARAAGKEMVIGFLGDATSLNPLVATDGQSYIAEWPMFDSLLELDQNLNVRPLLAESWEVSRDGLTYTFKLKKGVRWHDGKPFTARFRLRYPYGAFLAVLVNPRAGIIPEHLLKGVDLNTAEFNRKPVGTGPFRFVEWRRGERLVMEANAQYHGGRPALDRLIYRVIPDAVVLLQELRAGGVDFIESPPLTEVARLKQTQGLQVLVADNTSYNYLGYRQDLPPFDDMRVRRAFYHAVDSGTLIRQVLQGYAAPATGQFPPSSWAFDPSVKGYPFDPARAKALLAEAGWKPGPDGVLVKDGKRLSFSLRHDQA